eukprot:PhM_4_TR5245/c0_g1_i5/m.54290
MAVFYRLAVVLSCFTVGAVIFYFGFDVMSMATLKLWGPSDDWITPSVKQIGTFTVRRGVYRAMAYSTLPVGPLKKSVGNLTQSVVLVSHMTLDRLPQALRWCRAWRGPMSLALFIRPQDNRDDVMDTVLRHGDDRCLQRHADIHLVERTVGGGDANKTDMMTHYPFNVQRNAALDGVRHGTRWVFLVDVDMVLMPRNESSHAMFSAHLARVRAATPHAQMPQHSVLIVPSVETVVPEVPLPTTMEE